MYPMMKHVAYKGSCVAAKKISTIARPARKYVVALLKIFRGSKKKTRSNKAFATMVTKDAISM